MSYPEIALELTKSFFEHSAYKIDYYAKDGESPADVFNRFYTSFLDNICESSRKYINDADFKSGFQKWNK